MLSHDVQSLITAPPGERNITEWCKTEECWNVISSRVDRSPITKFGTLPRQPQQPIGDEPVAEVPPNSGEFAADAELIQQAELVDGEIWFGIAKWPREAGLLQPWQRSLAYSLGQRKIRGIAPSVKQARQGLKIIEQVRAGGFEIEQEIEVM